MLQCVCKGSTCWPSPRPSHPPPPSLQRSPGMCAPGCMLLARGRVWRHDCMALQTLPRLAQDVGSYRMAHLVADVAGVIQAVAPPSSGRVVLAGHDWWVGVRQSEQGSCILAHGGPQPSRLQTPAATTRLRVLRRGGEVAWHVAHAHPELLDKLVVLSAPHPSRFLPNLDRDQARRCAGQREGCAWRLGGCEAGRRVLLLTGCWCCMPSACGSPGLHITPPCRAHCCDSSWYIAAFQTPWIPEAVLRWGAYDMVGRMLAGRTMGCKNHLPQEVGAPQYVLAWCLLWACTRGLGHFCLPWPCSCTLPTGWALVGAP